MTGRLGVLLTSPFSGMLMSGGCVLSAAMKSFAARFSSITTALAFCFPIFTDGFLYSKDPKPSPVEAPSQAAPSPSGRHLVGEQPDGRVLVTTNQMVTPLGKVQTVADERPKDLALSPDGSLLAVLTTSKVH